MPPDSQRGPLPTGPPSSIGLAPNNLGRKEITWLAKNCHPKKLRRPVLSAERKWSLRVSRQFCSEGHSRISRSRARRAALRRNSGSNELDGLSLFSLVACPSAACRAPGERRQLEVIVGAPKNSIRSPTRRPSLSGGVVNIAQTRLVNGPRLKHDRDAITRRPSRHLYFPRRRRAFQSERIQRACPPIGPHRRTGTMPRMRRGDFDQTDCTHERPTRRTPHVRMQSMPRATSIHRRSRERNYSCDATLTGWSPQSNRSAENPGSYWPGFFFPSRQLAGRGAGACGFLQRHLAEAEIERLEVGKSQVWRCRPATAVGRGESIQPCRDFGSRLAKSRT